jgi:hypothetical protein
VEEYVGTRTGVQIRSHAQKYFNKLNKLQNEQKKQSSLNNPKLELLSENKLKEIKVDILEECKESVVEEIKGQPVDELVFSSIQELPLINSKTSSENKAEEIKESVDECKEMLEVNRMEEVKELLLSDPDLYKELLRHTETITSFKRLFKTLKCNSQSDPLLDVELDQGKKILSLIYNKVQEQFNIKRDMQQLYKYKDNLFKEIYEIQNIITDILLNLGREKYFKQLFDTT